VTGRLARGQFTHLPDVRGVNWPQAGAMELDGYAVLAVVLVLAVLLDVAALRWGVDSRFADVRSDLVRR
jgi:hypothetical protein